MAERTMKTVHSAMPPRTLQSICANCGPNLGYHKPGNARRSWKRTTCV